MLLRSRLFPPVLRALLLALAAAACQPSLPSPFPDGAADAPTSEPHAVLSPEAPLDSAPRVLRVQIVHQPGATVDVTRLLFVRGHVGQAHLRQVQDGDLSAALSERIVPSAVWTAEGTGILAPLSPLDPGATYGILSADPPLGLDIHVAPTDLVPLLPAVWPPPDAPDKGPFAIFCGDTPLQFSPLSLPLDPGPIPATFQPGLIARLGPRCLRLDAAPDISSSPENASPPGDDGSSSTSETSPPGDEAAPEGASPSFPAGATFSAAEAGVLLPPALLTLPEGAGLRLAPRLITQVAAPPPAPIAPLDCEPDQIPFGPGCARVADDRLFVSTPSAPLFWSIRSEPTGPLTRVTGPSETWVFTGLRSSEATTLQITTIDVAGAALTTSSTAHTSAPMPHVVISEVLANPLGAEPDQEWVELYNDGLADADLTGYTLTDIGGETALPSAILPPGAFALIVNDTFIEDDELDPVPPPSTLVLRVPKLGKTGLKNDGEPLKLLDSSGEVLSRFPATPKPKAGASVARLDLESPSVDAASFKVDVPTPGAPN